MSVFWDKYNEICKERNINPRKLAAELDISPATVTRWINGSVPRMETIKKLSVILQVPVVYFYNEDKEIDNVLKIVKARNNIQKLVELCNGLNDSQIDSLFICIAQMKIKKVEEECEKRKEQILFDCNTKLWDDFRK